MKRKACGVLLATALVIAASTPDLFGCTSFLISLKNGGIFLGENFDFPTGLGHVQVNLKGIAKRALISVPEKALRWTSKYGSVTFNQNGREFPYSGMNEAGLVVVKLMLDESVYPALDERFGLEELQWIQYQLDVSATVDDVIRSDRLLRVSYTSIAPLHFFLADARGHAAAIEYLDGRMVVHTGKDLAHKALANSPYRASLEYLHSLDAEARKKLLGEEGRTKSLERFARAALFVEALPPDPDHAGENVFDILGKVAQRSTHWSIVYDLKARIIRLKTARNKKERELRLGAFDFSSGAKRLFVDIDQDFKSASDFKEYDRESNARLIDEVWDTLEGFLSDLPFRKEWALYPDEVNSGVSRRFKSSAAKKIVELLKGSNYQAAQAEIQKIRKSQEEYYFGESEIIFNALYLAQNDNSRFPDAIGMLQLATELFPGSAKAYYWLGKAHGDSGNGDLALVNFMKALELDPENKLARWDMEGLKAMRNPPAMDQAALASYAGEYGDRLFSLENGRLVYERQGQPIILLPMSQDLFLCKGYDNLRFRFIQENGKIVAVEGLYNDGRVQRFERTK